MHRRDRPDAEAKHSPGFVNHLTTPQPKNGWTPLKLLSNRFMANLAALKSRYPAMAEALRSLEPTRTYFILPGEDRLTLGVEDEQSIKPLPQPLPPARALELVNTLYAKGVCDQTVMVLGEDLGWLWDRIYRLKCDYPGIPGFRPPLYFLIKNLEQLWAILHLHDWPALLADARVRLFAGTDAFEQFQASLIEYAKCPWPKLALGVDHSLWPAGMNIDTLLKASRQQCVAELTERGKHIHEIYQDFTPQAFAARCQPGSTLRVMGMTSRYTTFLKYSMRDWLAAFEQMGHSTQLYIENADHELPNSVAMARAITEFKPDLLVTIDHYRAEIGSIPDKVPVVMWVQDHLPNIFQSEAGKAQGPRDFCVGFGKLQLSQRFGYPRERFLAANIGVNPERFSPGRLSAEEIGRFGCDMSYVSHASTPAEVLVEQQIEQMNAPQGVRLFRDMYDRLLAHYEGGGPALDEPILNQMLSDSLTVTRCSVDAQTHGKILGLFSQSINNAIFRHQTLRWISELGVDLRIYGTGWEKHPQLARHARGPADNQTQLKTIYQASKINLQVTASGAVHQRLLDGLAAGGFFLIRYSIGDAIGRSYQRLWEWCQRNGVGSEKEFRNKIDSQAREIMNEINRIMGYELGSTDLKLFDIVRMHADNEFMTCADSIWPEYDEISFANREQLQERLATFLGDDGARRRVAESMRRRVIEKASYEHINSRLLEMISRDMPKSLAAEPTTLKPAA
jgi:hypothetical protein